MQQQLIQANETFALKKLKGIKPKQIKVKESSRLDYLNFVCHDLFSKHEFEFRRCNDYLPTDYFVKRVNKISKDLKPKLENFELDKSVITDFVLSNTNKEDLDLASYLGACSSVLLQSWVNDLKNTSRRSIFYINGGGNTFNSLFRGVSNIDLLIIDNFQGTQIASDMALGENSFVGSLFGLNINGKYCFTELATSKGVIGLLAVSNWQSNGCLGSISSWESCVDLFVANNIGGDDNFNNLCDHGTIRLLYANNIRGKNCFDDYDCLNNLKLAVVSDCLISQLNFLTKQYGPEEEILDIVVARKTISKKNPEQLKQVKEKYQLTKITNLLDEMNGASELEIIQNALQIEKIYHQIKLSLPNYYEGR